MMRQSVARQPAVALATEEVDFGVLGRAVWRRKALICGLTLLSAALAFAAVNMVVPRYKSEARVLIETRENVFMRPEAEKTAERGAAVDQEAVTSQVQLILSRDLARDVIRRLGLGERAEFDAVLRGTSGTQAMLQAIGVIRDPLDTPRDERVLRGFQERLTAYQVEKSRVIAIEFESEDSELAAAAANAVAETYLGLQQSTKLDQTRAAGSWLSGEIDKLSARVAEAESKVEQYRSKSNLFLGSNNTSLSNQQLTDFNVQVAAARAQRDDATSKARLLREGLRNGAPVEFSEVVNSDLIRRLSEQLITLRGQLAEQSSTLLAQHPRIKELNAQIADLERQLRVEADRLVRSLENDAKLADARMQALGGSFDQLKRQAASSNEQDVQLRALERDAKSQRDLLESYLAKYREATARDSIGAAAPEARIISAAVVSTTPAWPKKLPTVLMAGLGMLVLSMGLVMSGELLAGGVMAIPVDLPPERISGSASAAAALTQAMRAARAVPFEAERAASPLRPAAIDDLALQISGAGSTDRRITIVAGVHDAPTSLAALSLTRRLAEQGRAVLVELAPGASQLALLSADPSAPGIAELVRGTASIGEVITRDLLSRAHLIAAGQETAGTEALVLSQRLTVTLQALASSYDHVVIDAGALPDISLERFAKLAPVGVLIAGAGAQEAAEALRAQLSGAGFVDVSVMTPALAPAGQARVAA
jgi:succinoglycan biosynthesis transport protein ExoP